MKTALPAIVLLVSNVLAAQAQVTLETNTVVSGPAPAQVASPGTAIQTVQGTWQRDDIGPAALPGEASVAQGRFVIRSSGTAITAKQDSFEYVHQDWVGDGVFVARVAAVQGPRWSATAGLMVRAGLEADAAFLMVGLTGEGKMVLASRTKQGDLAKSMYFSAVPLERQAGLPIAGIDQDVLQSGIVPGVVWLGTNCWLKVERRGDVFSAFSSEDGSTWYWLGSERIQMAAAQVGLAVAGSEFFTTVSAQFEGLNLSVPGEAAFSAARAGSGDGLMGVYEGKSTGVQVQRIDPAIDFQWATNSPDPKIGSNQFQVRWEGMVEAQYSETYAITLVGRGGARLWIDDRLVTDQWHADYWFQQPGNPPEETTAELSLVAGKKYSLRLEYIQKYGQARAQLYWSSPSTPKQIIPQSQLYSHPDQPVLADRDGDGIPDRWEQAYGLDPNNPADANQDLNGDGIPNYKKYLAGMDPRRATAVQKLAGGWQSRDIGSVGIAGTNSVSGDQVEVGGAGDDILGRKDGFQFVYQPWHGDAEIVARIDALSGVIHNWAKAGIMIREDLTDRAKNAFVALTAANGITIQHRTEFSGGTSYNYWWWRKQYHWVKLVRRGDVFEMYTSLDGLSWEWLSTRSLPMEADVYVGLGVTSRDNTTLYSARFSSVRMGLPGPQSNPNAATALGDGLKATYRNLADSTTVVRTDPNIAFDWGMGQPALGIDPDRCVVTWEGKLEAPYNETCSIRLGIKNRARLWLDGALVWDWDTACWDGDGPNDHDFYGEWLPRVMFKRITLKAGYQYDFKLEVYNDNEGRSLAMLYWSSPSITAQPIPQKYFYSPASKYYGHLPDADGDGIPDAWMLAYFGHRTGMARDQSRAQDDADGDGLTNLEEYQAGSDPRKADSNGDGIPDAWCVKHGLAAGGEPIANESARDGLTMLEEYRRGLDPTRAVDGEIPLGDIESTQTVAQVLGREAVAKLGQWAQDKDAIYAISRRGYVEYELKVPQADMYQVEVWGGPHGRDSSDAQFPLILSMDGDYLGRPVLIGRGSARALTPWLPAGPHKLRVFWDNTFKFRAPLEITSVKLVSVKGKDRNTNGVSDWVEARLKNLSGLETGITNVIQSYVSPYTLEGRERYLGTLKLASGGQAVTVHPGAEPRWYADVPLQLRSITPVDASFENDGLRQSAQIEWVPLDLMLTNQITIRKGDSLLLSVGGNGKAVNNLGVVHLVVPGVTNCTGTQPIPIRFDKAGTFTVTGTRPDLNDGQSYSLQVTVVDWAFPGNPPAWAGRYRNWTLTNAVQQATVVSGGKTALEKTDGLAQASGSYRLKVQDTTANHVVARLGPQGPVLASAEIKGFQLASGSATGVQVVRTYEDGSQLIEMGLVMSPVRAEVTVKVRLIVAGVMFEDGTIEKTFTAQDFNELGEASVRFIRPQEARSSVCHNIEAFDGTTPLGVGN
jgi:regulation of enolase protein 1 (concanavalin A-like superfamily)